MTRIHWLRYAVNALMVVVLVATTVVPEVSHGLLAALALLGLLEALARRDIAWRLPPEVLALAALPLVALLVTTLAMLGGTDIPRLGWRKMEDLSWMFLLVPAWYLFRRHLDVRALALGVGLAAAVAGVWAAVEAYGQPVGFRSLGGAGKPIVFGILSMALATAAAGLSFCFPARWWLRVAMLAAALLGLLAAVFSGSRGAYLAVPLIGLLFWVSYRKRVSAKVVYWILAGGMLVILVVWNISSLPTRMETAWHEIRAYATAENPTKEAVGRTSLGLRFEMWKAAADESLHHPFLGVGLGNVNQVFVSAAEAGQANIKTELFDHAHNEFLNAALTRGLPGLAASLAVLLVPAFAFRRCLGTHRCVAVTGLGVVLLFAFAGLSDSVFYFKKDLVLYTLLILSFSAILSRQQQDAAPLR